MIFDVGLSQIIPFVYCNFRSDTVFNLPVMDILQGSRCKRNGSHIVAEMIDSPEAVCMEDPRTEVLFNIDDLKTRHEYSALFTYWEELPASNILLLDYVREILKLQRNGEGQDAEGMLDAIESYVRTRVDVSY